VIRTSIAHLALLAALSLVAGCSDTDPDSDSNAGGGSQAAADNGGCAQVEAPEPRDDGGATEPGTMLDPAKRNTVTFSTSCGAFTITLDAESARTTSASVAALARSGFYDNTTFHRIVPGFVIQGGDPTGTGSGGPGYSTVDKPASTAKYTSGVVAMAKAADEAPGTSGSQFFVVTAPDSGLPPDYAIVGKVTKGMDTVKRIEALGTPSEQPSRPVVIKKATFDAR
jgi:cyclophilin family peptidyl-prolyl cis-trans isomerase